MNMNKLNLFFQVASLIGRDLQFGKFLSLIVSNNMYHQTRRHGNADPCCMRDRTRGWCEDVRERSRLWTEGSLVMEKISHEKNNPYTGCSLDIVFFSKIFKYIPDSGLSRIPLSISVCTQWQVKPQCLQQNILRKNIIFYEHPVSILLIRKSINPTMIIVRCL